MKFLSGSNGWWVFLIVAIFALIGLVVFILRKKIPGLIDYEEHDEEEIAHENLSNILVDLDIVEEDIEETTEEDEEE